MAWTYGADPATSSRDHVRFLIGDTDSTNPLVPDSVIDAFLATESVGATSVKVLRGLAAEYASKPDRKIGRLSISSSQQASAFSARADELDDLESDLALAAAPWSAAASVGEHAAAEGDASRIPSYFKTGVMDQHEKHDA